MIVEYKDGQSGDYEKNLNVRSARLEDSKSKLTDADCNNIKFKKINRFKRLRKSNLISNKEITANQFQLCLGFNIDWQDCQSGTYFDDKPVGIGPLYSKTFSKSETENINPFCMR
jgi:hypothetical protein